MRLWMILLLCKHYSVHLHKPGLCSYSCNCMCCAFRGLAAQWVCLHRHHLKHVSNVLCKSLPQLQCHEGGRGFSADTLLWNHTLLELLSYMQSLVDWNVNTQHMTIDPGESVPPISSFSLCLKEKRGAQWLFEGIWRISKVVTQHDYVVSEKKKSSF